MLWEELQFEGGIGIKIIHGTLFSLQIESEKRRGFNTM